MKRVALILFFVFFGTVAVGSNPVADLVDRIDNGASKKFIFQLSDPSSEDDFFTIDTKNGKIAIMGNNWVSVACGLNWYLKYYAGVHISWNNPCQRLSDLPKPKKQERRTTNDLLRYYLNYCTFSYSMPFWGQQRWQQEIDFMALHGINMPLMLVGSSTVWRNTLLELGYSMAQITDFIAGPAFQAWWLMGNIEGWGGPNTENYYQRQAKLAQWIMAQYDLWGITPVLPGYGGMLPNFAPADTSRYGNLSGLTLPQWCGYDRPALIDPQSEQFGKVAEVYYDQQGALLGRSRYYAIDPMHESVDTQGLDFAQTGRAIFSAMQSAAPASVWVVQAWQDNPRAQMIEPLGRGSVVVLDLFSESRPQWGDSRSEWYRKDGFQGHHWVYCMLLNFGANTGMYGKMERVVDGYYLARSSPAGVSLTGVGATMEGIQNNAVMYELLYELPWRAEKFSVKQWMDTWVDVRYGRQLPQTIQAWEILSNTVYAAAYESVQEGASESVFCARPALEVQSVSTWGRSAPYYDVAELRRALSLMCQVGEKYRGCNNFEYDIVDVARQALSDYGYELLADIARAFDAGQMDQFKLLSGRFLEAITLQDRLLSSRSEFMVGSWIEQAMQLGVSAQERDWLRWNARTQITTWGNRQAANLGGLGGYAHKQWAGLMSDYYYPRWRYFFDHIINNRQLPVGYDYYDMESEWATATNPYPNTPQHDPIAMAQEVNMFLGANISTGTEIK